MLKTHYIPNITEAGCDEAGRGPLAGSVFAAAVILPTSLDPNDEPMWDMINDSKQMSEHRRQQCRQWIETHAPAWAVAEVTAEEIDTINILNASLLAMQRALDKLTIRPKHILVDGNRWRDYIPSGQVMAVPATTVVHGDATYLSIAAASILAKTYRDDYMQHLDNQYPMYGWQHNMGYPTAEHYAALKQYGPSPYHRQSFRLIK